MLVGNGRRLRNPAACIHYKTRWAYQHNSAQRQFVRGLKRSLDLKLKLGNSRTSLLTRRRLWSISPTGKRATGGNSKERGAPSFRFLCERVGTTGADALFFGTSGDTKSRFLHSAVAFAPAPVGMTSLANENV